MTVPQGTLNTAFNKCYIQIAKSISHCSVPTGLIKRNGQHHEYFIRDLFLNLAHFLSPKTDKQHNKKF